MKTLIIVLLFFFVPLSNIKSQDTTELNSLLMRTTHKIKGDKGKFGTVFLLAKRTRPNSDYFYIVLVTAKHVLDSISGDSATIYLRKKKNEAYSTLPYRIAIKSKGKKLYTSHPTEDVAAMFINYPKSADSPLLDYNMLATDERLRKYNIHPGDELLCLGFPLGYETNPGSFPILRSGKIASYPLIPTSKTKSYLLDFEIYQGNSGGPVYLVQTNRRHHGRMELGKTLQMIMGLVSAEPLLQQTVKSLYEERRITYKLSIAKIVHAPFIKETIEMIPTK